MLTRGDIVVLTYGGDSDYHFVGLVLSSDLKDGLEVCRAKYHLSSDTNGYSIEHHSRRLLTKIGSLEELGLRLPDDYREDSPWNR